MGIKKDGFEEALDFLLNMEKELLEETAKMEELPLFAKRQFEANLGKVRQSVKALEKRKVQPKMGKR